VTTNNLVERLADDDRIPLSAAELQAIVTAGRSNAGAAAAQIQDFTRKVTALGEIHPAAARYTPGSIL